MKYYSFLFIIILLSVFSCKSVKYVPVANQTSYTYIDSTIISIDTDTVEIPIYISSESHTDYVKVTDTLWLTTSTSKAYAVVDTVTKILKGGITQKSDTIVKQVPVYLPSKERVVYRDSIVTKEIPVEVEVVKSRYNKFFWFLLSFFIITLVSTLGYFGWKNKDKIVKLLSMI